MTAAACRNCQSEKIRRGGMTIWLTYVALIAFALVAVLIFHRGSTRDTGVIKGTGLRSFRIHHRRPFRRQAMPPAAFAGKLDLPPVALIEQHDRLPVSPISVPDDEDDVCVFAVGTEHGIGEVVERLRG